MAGAVGNPCLATVVVFSRLSLEIASTRLPNRSLASAPAIVLIPGIPVKTNPVIVRKALAILVIAFGVFVCVTDIYSSVRHFLTSPRQELMGYIIVVPFMLIMFVFGVMFIMAGVRLYQAVNEAVLKNCVGLAAFIVGAWTSARLSLLFPHQFSREIQHSLFSVIGAVVGIAFYLVILRKLLKMMGCGNANSSGT